MKPLHWPAFAKVQHGRLNMEFDAAEQIVCPKCNHLNDPKAEHCAQCQGHLYIQCRSCGEKNPRQAQRCSECGKELHRVKRKRREHQAQTHFNNGAWKWVLLVLILTLGILAWIIFGSPIFKRPL